MTEETTKSIETTGKMRTRLFVIPYLSLVPMVSLFSLFSLVIRLLWLQDNYHQLAISQKRYIGLINKPLNSIYTADILVVTNDHKETIGG